MANWKEFKIMLANSDSEEMGINSDLLESRITIDLSKVCAYYENCDDDDKLIYVTVVLNCGLTYQIVNCMYDEFVELMKEVKTLFAN